MYVLVNTFNNIGMPNEVWYSMIMGEEPHTYPSFEWLAERFLKAKGYGFNPTVYRLVPLTEKEQKELQKQIWEAEEELEQHADD